MPGLDGLDAVLPPPNSFAPCVMTREDWNHSGCALATRAWPPVGTTTHPSPPTVAAVPSVRTYNSSPAVVARFWTTTYPYRSAKVVVSAVLAAAIVLP